MPGASWAPWMWKTAVEPEPAPPASRLRLLRRRIPSRPPTRVVESGVVRFGINLALQASGQRVPPITIDVPQPALVCSGNRVAWAKSRQSIGVSLQARGVLIAEPEDEMLLFELELV